MSEVRSEVKTYLISYACDECGKGFMKPGPDPEIHRGEVLHRCDECHQEEYFDTIYPETVYEYY